jgi:hypothetical protein
MLILLVPDKGPTVHYTPERKFQQTDIIRHRRKFYRFKGVAGDAWLFTQVYVVDVVTP